MHRTGLTASEKRDALAYMFAEREILMSLCYSLAAPLDDEVRQQIARNVIASLSQAAQQTAKNLLWQIFPFDEENFSKWQQSER